MPWDRHIRSLLATVNYSSMCDTQIAYSSAVPLVMCTPSLFLRHVERVEVKHSTCFLDFSVVPSTFSLFDRGG